jgi:hypothetical protein
LLTVGKDALSASSCGSERVWLWCCVMTHLATEKCIEGLE